MAVVESEAQLQRQTINLRPSGVGLFEPRKFSGHSSSDDDIRFFEGVFARMYLNGIPEPCAVTDTAELEALQPTTVRDIVGSLATHYGLPSIVVDSEMAAVSEETVLIAKRKVSFLLKGSEHSVILFRKPNALSSNNLALATELEESLADLHGQLVAFEYVPLQ